MVKTLGRALALLLMPLLVACHGQPWNDPYPAADAGKNIFYTAFQERPKHLDPAQAYSANEYAIIAQVYEPPLQYQYLKRPYTLVPLTAAAMPTVHYEDAQGRPLPDDAPADKIAYSVYEIHIRPGIDYQPHPAFARDTAGRLRYDHLTAADLDGVNTLADFHHTGTRELVADDYVYEIKRLADPRVESPIFGLMSGYIVGLKDYARTLKAARAHQLAAGGSPHLDLDAFPLKGAQVVNRYTYRITIHGKYPQFKYWLAMPFFAPMPPEADRFYDQPGMAERNITLDWYPVGTGPYMLTINNPNRQMILVRNPNFHHEDYPSEGMPGDAAKGLLADAGKPLPFINKVVFSLEKESIPYWNKFLQGYYDRSGIGSDNFDQAIHMGSGGEVSVTPQMRAKGIRLETSVGATVYYTGFNMLDPVVGGYSERARKLRRAIAIAVDEEQYISIFLNGRGMAAQGPLPPGIFGYRTGKAGINPYVYDWTPDGAVRKPLEVARQLLAEAGYPDGRDARTGKPLLLNLDTPAAGPDAKAQFDWWRKQLAKLNIQLEIRATDYNRFQDKMRKGTEQLFQWGWNADYPDPENFFFLLYGPNGEVAHNGENSANYENPEFDRLFDQMKNMDNGPARQAIIQRMLDIVRRDGPWLWGFYPKDFALSHAWVHNLKPNLMANNTLKYIRIDPALRERLRRKWNPPIVWPVGLVVGVVALFGLPAVVTYRRRERAAARRGAGGEGAP